MVDRLGKGTEPEPLKFKRFKPSDVGANAKNNSSGTTAFNKKVEPNYESSLDLPPEDGVIKPKRKVLDDAKIDDINKAVASLGLGNNEDSNKNLNTNSDSTLEDDVKLEDDDISAKATVAGAGLNDIKDDDFAPKEDDVDDGLDTLNFNTNTAKSATKKSHKGLWITLGSILGVVALGAGGMYIFFQSHYMPNVKASGVNVGWKTSTEALKEVDKAKGLNKTQTIKVNTGASVKEINLPKVYDVSQKDFDDALKNKESNIKLNVNNKYEDELKAKLAEVPYPKGKEAKNAYLVKTQNGFEIMPEVKGTVINKEALNDDIIKDALAGKTGKTYSASNYYKPATITSTNKALVARKNTYNARLNKKITLKINKATYVIPKATISSFINANGSVNSAKVYAWVSGALNDKYSTVKKGVTFTNAHGVKMHYSKVQDVAGWDINWPSARDAIVKALNGKESATTLTLKIDGDVTSKAVLDPNTDTYIEVDLNEQRVYMHYNGKLIVNAPCLTGSTKGNAGTPPGYFKVLSKDHNRYLSGENENIAGKDKSYKVFVNYFIPLVGNGWTISGVGLHNYPHKEDMIGDANLYKTSTASGGCITMRKADVAKIDKYAVAASSDGTGGTPILVYGTIYNNYPNALAGKVQEQPTILN